MALNSPALSNLEGSESLAYLQWQNHDLKKQIRLLESQVKQAMKGEAVGSELEELLQENVQLRQELDEKHNDMELRNTLLIKAKSAIESLKLEIERLQKNMVASQQQNDELSNKVNQLTRNASSNGQDRVLFLEKQVSQQRQAIAMLEDEKVQLEKDYVHVQEQLRLLESSSMPSTAHQKKVRELSDELVQARADSDIFKIQLSEQVQMIDELKVLLEDAHTRQQQLETDKRSLEEKRVCDLQEQAVQYEAQIRDMKNIHKQELENLRESHMNMLATVRDNYTVEIAKHKQHTEEIIHELRHSDVSEAHRIKEDLMSRINEKSSEIQSLKHALENERSKCEGLNRDVERLRADQQHHHTSHDTSKAQNLQLQEEIRSYKVEIAKYRDSADLAKSEVAEIKAQLQVQSLEFRQAQHAIEQYQNKIEDLSAQKRATDDFIESLQLELARCKSESDRLNERASAVEVTLRENERLKHNLNQCQQLQQELSLKMTEANKKVEALERDSMRYAQSEQELQRRNETYSEQQQILQHQIQQLESALKESRVKCSMLESNLHDLRERNDVLQQEIVAEKEHHHKLEMQLQQGSTSSQAILSQFRKSSQIGFTNMMKWDLVLDNVLEYFDCDQNASSQSVLIDQYQELPKDIISRLEYLLLNPEEFVEATIRAVERIHSKFGKIAKLRNSFQTKLNNATQRLFSAHARVEDRVQLFVHRLQTLQRNFDESVALIHKDRQVKEEHMKELDEFKSKVLEQHAAQLQHADDKVSLMASHLDSAQRTIATLEKNLEEVEKENRVLRSEKQQLIEAEQRLKSMSEKLNDIIESNRLLTLEVDDKENTHKSLNSRIELLLSEKDSLLNAVDRLTSQVEIRDGIINEHQRNIESLRSEISHLRSRQMNPELEKTIRETEEAMKMNYSRAASSKALDVTDLDTSQATFHKNDLVDRVQHIISAAAQLLRDSKRMLSDFELIRESSTRKSWSKSMDSYEQNVYELLEANSKLSVQLQQVTIDFKRFCRQISHYESSPIAESEVVPDSPPAPSQAPLRHTLSRNVSDIRKLQISVPNDTPSFSRNQQLEESNSSFRSQQSLMSLKSFDTPPVKSASRITTSTRKHTTSSTAYTSMRPATGNATKSSRIHQLSADLQQLAGKLNSFETRKL